MGNIVSAEIALNIVLRNINSPKFLRGITLESIKTAKPSPTENEFESIPLPVVEIVFK